MSNKRLLATATLLAIIVSLASMTILWATSQILTGTPNEVRKEALVKTLSNLQTANGSFKGIYRTPNYGIPHTSRALTTLAALKRLDRIDLEKAVNYMVSLQNHTTGGFPDEYLIYGELNTPFEAVRALESVNSSSKLDLKLIDFVMQRYNETEGAFHEPTFELSGVKVAWCHFPMMGFGNQDNAAYGKSNVISTYLAVDILKNLDALDRINATKTANWVLSCRADNGGFGAFPIPKGEPFYQYYGSNPFFVDSHGAGVAFTFAAVGVLKGLDSLSRLSPEEIERIRNYVLSCQAERGYFTPNADAATGLLTDNSFFHTHFATMTLYDINAIYQSRQDVAKAENWLLSQQDFENTQTYGLFHELPPEARAYDAVLSLNASGSLYLLDELTPRALEQRTLFLGISTAIAFTTFIVTIATPYIVKLTQEPKRNNETPENQTHST